MSSLPVRGELWWCEPPEIGRRPVVILSRNAAIPRLRRALPTRNTCDLGPLSPRCFTLVAVDSPAAIPLRLSD